MSDVFISYARSTARQAQTVAEALRGLGYGVWIDDDLPAHRAYADVIGERLKAAKAVVVVWSAEAVKSQWVRAEADIAREAGTLVQLKVDDVIPPLPFNQIQCADLTGWTGDLEAPGWRKVIASVGELIVGAEASTEPVGRTSPPLPSKPSIAVMPFANLSGDPEQDYFADGMVEEIVAELSRFKSIFVIGSGSTLSFKGKAVSPQEVGRDLGVRYVLEGSVRKAGGRVRIAVKLLDARDGAQIWADRFEDTLEDVFALQDRVALSVAGVIGPAVKEAEIRQALQRPTDNLGAYDLYLRALPLYRTQERDGNLQALDLLNRAIELDPDYGSALSLAASCHSRIAAFGWLEEAESHRDQGVELARHALRVGSDDPEILVRAASVLSQDSQEDVSALFDRAITLNPGSSLARVVISDNLLRVGDADRAVEHIEASMRLDPFSPLRPVQLGILGAGRFEQGRFVEAVAALRESAQLLSVIPINQALLAACYGHLAQPDAAREAIARYRALSAQPIEVCARAFIHDPAQRKLLLDGIALAEAKSPTDAPARTE